MPPEVRWVSEKGPTPCSSRKTELWWTMREFHHPPRLRLSDADDLWRNDGLKCWTARIFKHTWMQVDPSPEGRGRSGAIDHLVNCSSLFPDFFSSCYDFRALGMMRELTKIYRYYFSASRPAYNQKRRNPCSVVLEPVIELSKRRRQALKPLS